MLFTVAFTFVYNNFSDAFKSFKAPLELVQKG